MHLVLLPDWRTRLSQHIEAERLRPFSWGEHDCCLWVGDCIRAMTGEDPAAEYRGTYDSAVGAIRRMREVDGVRSPHELALKRLGPTKAWQFARAGDVVAA